MVQQYWLVVAVLPQDFLPLQQLPQPPLAVAALNGAVVVSETAAYTAVVVVLHLISQIPPAAVAPALTVASVAAYMSEGKNALNCHKHSKYQFTI